jgi:hypothetical protein
MEPILGTEPYFLTTKGPRSLDASIKNWQSTLLRQRKTSEYLQTETDIVNTINNMSAEIASLKEALSINNEFLKATNDLLRQIIDSLRISEAQSYFWTEEWQEGEREATKDIERGDVQTFDRMEQLIGFLHSKSK